MTRSKGTDKELAKTCSKKIADYADVEKIITGPKQLKNGKEYIEVTAVSKTNRRKKRIYALAANDLSAYTLIDTVKGKDFFLCIYLGARCNKNFWKRIRGYHINARKYKKFKFAVSFYEKK